MRMLLILVGVCAGVSAQTPVFTSAAPLDCGARLYTPDQVQTWCFIRGVTNVLAHNSLTQFNIGPTISTHKDDQYEYTDFATGQGVKVAWSFEQTGISGDIKYIISYSICNTTSGCQDPVVSSGVL